MFFSFSHSRFMFLCVLLIAGSVAAFPTTILNTEDLHHPGDGARSHSQVHTARAINEGDVADISQYVVGPVAGGLFVLICLLVFFFCFRMRKGPTKEDMAPLPVAERPPWAA
ncbi:hypothetical protein MVEN_00159400 [Mycena venus]|uniref:Uncharacterized protein n=1 Tax=Mycena venus TaxID=2733690 RepID=A0A8H6Z0H3_9AGAR|nr:hypothetical protein MVEN_00159400 [Mycena venus]